jgi:TolB protein
VQSEQIDIDEVTGRSGRTSWRSRARTAALIPALVFLAGAGVAACGTGTPAASGGSGGSSTITGSSGDTTTTPSSAPTSTSAQTTLPPAPPLAAGQQGLGSAIPWSEVGTGWSVAIWNPGSASAASTVFVVDPAGGRYAAASLPASLSYPQISDWSGDKQRVLITSMEPGTGGGTVVTDIDLATGATVGNFVVGGAGLQSNITFSKPDGLAILAGSYASQGGQPVSWHRYSPSGAVEQTFPGTFPKVGKAGGTALYTPDGTQIVIGATNGLAVVENTGAVVGELPIPGASNGCDVLRWWQPGQALALCATSSGSTFWAVPTSGGAPIAIDSVLHAAPFNVWQANGTLYAQEGACGTVYIVKLGAGGSQTNVAVPETDSSDSEVVIGADGNDLMVRATSSCDTAGKPVQPSLLWFDVAKNTSTVILGTPVNGGDVQSAFLYDTEGY